MAKSLPEQSLLQTLGLDHLTTWQLRQHLIDITVELADALILEGDSGRLVALAHLYQTTIEALEKRDRRAAR